MYRKATKTLLIVDHDEILQEKLQNYLNNQYFCAQFLSDDNKLPYILASNRVDLIVLDVMLPNKSGFYWLKWLRQYHPHIPVIIASVKASEHDRLFGLKIGARDYVSKPFQCGELLIRIENILGQRVPANGAKIIHIGDLKLDIDKGVVFKEECMVKLTELETNILKLLHINSGSVISRAEIISQIRGTTYNPLDRSIDIHINSLRKKIENNPAEPIYIRTVRGKGYRLHIPSLLLDEAI